MPETLELHFVEFLLLSIKLAILVLLDMAGYKLLPCAICGRFGQLDDVRQQYVLLLRHVVQGLAVVSRLKCTVRKHLANHEGGGHIVK